jgi:hypothetical protein
MKSSGPPTLATWLMTRLTSGEKRESLIGDLIEQHRRGRSSAWYWRQTLSAIVTSFTAQAWRHKVLAILAVAMGTYMGDIYMFIMQVSGLRWLDRWYAPLMRWLLEAELDGVWHVAYSLHIYAWMTTIEFCALLAAVVWIASRFRPRQMGVVVTIFLVTQIGLCAPYLRIAFTDWLNDPGNPIWFFNLLWFSIFTFVLVPLSIILGGLYGGRREGSSWNAPMDSGSGLLL